MLRYKDYNGSVTFDDGKLIIKLLYVDDTVVDECDTASGAQACFEAMVEDYIETCALIGKEPSKPFKGSFNVRVAPATHRRAALAAADCKLSLNAWIEGAITDKLDEKRPHIDLASLRSLISFENMEQGGYTYRPTIDPHSRTRHVVRSAIPKPSAGLLMFESAERKWNA